MASVWGPAPLLFQDPPRTHVEVAYLVVTGSQGLGAGSARAVQPSHVRTAAWYSPG